MFALHHSERNKFCNPIPSGLYCESNRALGVSAPVMFSYLADCLRMSGLRVWKYHGCVGRDGFENNVRLPTNGPSRSFELLGDWRKDSRLR